VTKDVMRWRTALVVRELEQEIAQTESFAAQQAELSAAMERKSRLELRYSQLRLSLQRIEAGYAAPIERDAANAKLELASLRGELATLDGRVAELAKRSSELGNRRWGPLMRAGNDKSRMARQLERYADIYMSRVSNLAYCTPFGYLRPPPGALPHDVPLANPEPPA
jgi:chromosome segregation ATPase